MRLERLEISGFKSFSDRAELAFDRGVTAIVGPNGCGKSNVADAITWVLGEQSAKSLRGEKMEDVIFGGSDARKPGAAAEVRLRLSGLGAPASGPDLNSVRASLGDLEAPEPVHARRCGERRQRGATETVMHGRGRANGHEHAAIAALVDEFSRDVEVTRRLYRSGESEYLIDGEVCRLRDVHELLMDTGLGAKAYAIIEQGKIGMILSSRPADRRQLIEEAAGITKYKSRRRSAELKLEAAQQNLTRIDDIVFEVEKQRGTLKRQAAKARRYRRLRDELRRWEKVLFASRYRELAATHRGRPHAGWRRRASARPRRRRAWPRSKPIWGDSVSSRRRPISAQPRFANRRTPASSPSIAASSSWSSTVIRPNRSPRAAADVHEEIRDLDARREPARIALESRRQAMRRRRARA